MLAFGAPANSDEADGALGEEPGTLTFKFGVIPTEEDKEGELVLSCGLNGKMY